MNRRDTVLTLLALGIVPLTGWGQQLRKVPLIGFLHPATPQGNFLAFFDAFRQGLHELGYAEGKNVELVVRWGGGKLDRLPALAAELVRLRVDVFVAASSPSVLAAKQATRTIPIVMPVSSDPVGDGLVASLARPGGNITGLSVMAPEVGAKRLQLLREVVPKQSRPVAVLWNPAYTGMAARFRDAQREAPAVGMTVRSYEVRDSRELEGVLDSITRERPDAMILLADPLTLSQRFRIVEFAAETRIPAMYETSGFTDVGGLMSYGPNTGDLYRRAATYVDKILKGAKPAELPIEQPSKFEFIVNLKTAKALGITIPQSVLMRADRVIE